MPLFGSKKKEKSVKEPLAADKEPPKPMDKSTSNGTSALGEPPEQPRTRPRLVFHCQQAQGSPTGVISGFTNVKELYQKIAECYDLEAKQILFCTLNTHKVDMTRLLGGQIGLEDFIFAHIKGQPKEVEIDKTEDALGLTITDNGAGYAFIKRIKEGSVMDKIEGIFVGDHIEKINDETMVGCRHFEVAKKLKEIVKGTTFKLRIVEPVKSGFGEIGPSSRFKKDSTIGPDKKKTLRLRKKGDATVEMPDDIVDVATEKINALLETYMGINDTELAQSIWEIGAPMKNPSEFAMAVDKTDLEEFGFTEEFKFDLWGAINDAKSGRLKQSAEFNEKF